MSELVPQTTDQLLDSLGVGSRQLPPNAEAYTSGPWVYFPKPSPQAPPQPSQSLYARYARKTMATNARHRIRATWMASGSLMSAPLRWRCCQCARIARCRSRGCGRSL
jgi:hypothetical protein